MSCLIIYATKYGSVQKVAKMLKDRLGDETVMVNVLKEKVPNLDDYETVILGGSIYVGKIQKPLTNYINRNLPKLLQKRIGLFICGGQEELLTKELREAFPDQLFNHAIVTEAMGHEFNFDKLSFLHKIMIKKVLGVTTSYSKLAEEKIVQFADVISRN